jgi:hypothetical protein
MAQQMVTTKRRRTNPRLGNLRFARLDLQLSHALPSNDISVCDIITGMKEACLLYANVQKPVVPFLPMV